MMIARVALTVIIAEIAGVAKIAGVALAAIIA